MGLEQKLSLKLSQRLVMTPTLQQAIKLLQMTRLELSDIVNQEMVENPVLEEEEGGTPSAEEESAAERSEPMESPSDRTDGGEEMEVGSRDDSGAAGTDLPAESAGTSAVDAAQPEVPGPETPETFDQIDLESYFGDYMDGTAVAPRMDEQGEEYSLENRAESAPCLADHLTEQLGVSDASDEVREACVFLIGNVDPDGYLRVSLEEIEKGVPCSSECAAEAVGLLQALDPLGVGARSLSECLLIQARAHAVESPLLVDLVTNRLSDLATKPPALLARQMNVPLDELQRVIEKIRRLNPRPGRQYDARRTIYVEPDVTVVKVDDDYVVLFNDDGMPRLKVSSLYRRMLAAKDGALDGEGKSYLREKMRAAQWLMKSLDQRKRTIVRVAESIVKKQRDFLDYGVAHLRPLVLRDVAEDIGMHESTVSRVVSNKWMSTPRGLVPMKFFFHSAIASSGGGEDVSSLAVKGKIRALIEAEDPARPLSDARLAELLARDGIRIARRTVAKYREELRIPASSIRRADDPVATLVTTSEASGNEMSEENE